ncbi:MAG: hypothetical protein R6V10_05480 [bacterium]
MKFKKTAFALLALLALAGVYMGVFAEEPSHFFNPDPACPICQTLHTQLVNNPPLLLTASVFGTCYAVLCNTFQKCKGFCDSNISIRAPPFF